jgi:hypothetical protein
MDTKSKISKKLADFKANYKAGHRLDKTFPLIPMVGLMCLFPGVYVNPKARITNKIVAAVSHSVYIPLLIWFVNYGINQAELKEAEDIRFFMKHATEQNIADFDRLKELRGQKKTFTGNSYFKKLLDEYETKYQTALDSAKYIQGLSK